MGDIQDVRSAPALRQWMGTAYADYLEELVVFGAAYERDAHGVWQPDHLSYWIDNVACTALALVGEGQPVAFACIGLEAFPYRRQQTQFCLAEFWVAPEHRRGGTGAAFARSLFARFPGAWELTVLPANGRALAFWRAVLPPRREVAAADGIDFVFEIGTS
jgi:predicted acetyltransferase